MQEKGQVTARDGTRSGAAPSRAARLLWDTLLVLVLPGLALSFRFARELVPAFAAHPGTSHIAARA